MVSKQSLRAQVPKSMTDFRFRARVSIQSGIEGENGRYEWTNYKLNIPVRKGSCTQTRCSVNGNLCVYCRTL